jgi:hypothetical protein
MMWGDLWKRKIEEFLDSDVVKRRRCVVCGKLTEKWQRVNGSAWHCYDGCLSTTGHDNRKASEDVRHQG